MDIFGKIFSTCIIVPLNILRANLSKDLKDLENDIRASFKVNGVKIIEIKDDKIRFSKRSLNKDPLDWFKNKMYYIRRRFVHF